jgi:hypothetical protein
VRRRAEALVGLAREARPVQAMLARVRGSLAGRAWTVATRLAGLAWVGLGRG